MQVPTDPVALAQQQRHLLSVLGVSQLEGHSRLPSDELSDLQVLGGEERGSLLAQEQHDTHTLATVDHRGVERRTEAGQGLDLELGVVPQLVQRRDDESGLVGQGLQGTSLGREVGADEVSAVGAVGDLAHPGLADAGQDQGGRVRVGDLAHPPGNEGQGVVLLGAGQEHRRQLLGDGHPLLAAARDPVQA